MQSELEARSSKFEGENFWAFGREYSRNVFCFISLDFRKGREKRMEELLD